MDTKPASQHDKFIVRLPDGMRDQIAAAAKANNRTMNAEVVARLKLTFELSDTSPEDVSEKMSEMAKYMSELTGQIRDVNSRISKLVEATGKLK